MKTIDKLIVIGGVLRSNGVKYKLGAKEVPPTIPKELDCSGFVRYCFLYAGIKIPDGTYYQFHASKPIKGKIKKGDVGFLQLPSEKGINHIGIYIGNGNWMHCNYKANGISIEPTNMFKHIRRFEGLNEEEYKVEKSIVRINGEDKKVDTINVGGKVFISIRDIESKDIKVGWVHESKKVTIDTK